MLRRKLYSLRSRIKAMQERFDEKVRMLNEDQRHVVTNVAVFDFIPNWFFVLQARKHGGILKFLPEDVVEQSALITGLMPC